MLHLDSLQSPISAVPWHFACTSALTFAKLCYNLHACIFLFLFKLKFPDYIIQVSCHSAWHIIGEIKKKEEEEKNFPWNQKKKSYV